MTSENKVTINVLIPETPKIFYESLTGRYFESDFNKVRKVVNEINYCPMCGRRLVK